MNNIFRRAVLNMSLMFTVANVMLGQTQLQPNAKLKTVEYKSADYIAVGYIDKKMFVENQNVTILSKQTKDTIISGKYFMQVEKAYIDGIWKRNSENSITRAYGLFEVSNSDSEIGLTTNNKKAGSLSIVAKDISKYKGFHNQFPAILEKKTNKEGRDL